MKKYIISLLVFIFICIYFIFSYNTNTNNFEQLKQEIELKNYNMEVFNKQYTLSVEQINKNSKYILEFLKLQEDFKTDKFDFVSDVIFSDIVYFKQIINTKNDNYLEVMSEDLFKHYVFLESDTNIIVDFYLFLGGTKPVILKLNYTNGEIINSEIY